jgi:hypothetical protein
MNSASIPIVILVNTRYNIVSGSIPERSKGTDLRSVTVMLRGFESHYHHHSKLLRFRLVFYIFYIFDILSYKQMELRSKIIPILLALFLLIFVCIGIRNQISEHYLQDDPVLKKLREKFEQFFSQERYWSAPLEMLNERDVMNEITMYRGDMSYTINKEKVYICLKNEDGEYYNENMLIYVLAHEISHVLCDEIGHTDKFHRIFDTLLDKMSEDGLYNPAIPIEMEYCATGDPEV